MFTLTAAQRTEPAVEATPWTVLNVRNNRVVSEVQRSSSSLEIIPKLWHDLLSCAHGLIMIDDKLLVWTIFHSVIVSDLNGDTFALYGSLCPVLLMWANGGVIVRRRWRYDDFIRKYRYAALRMAWIAACVV
jgi:hypothetical protein